MPTHGRRRGAARGQGRRPSSRRSGARARVTDRAFGALADERVRRAHRARPRLADASSSSARHGGRGPRVPTDRRRPGRTARARTREPADRRSRPATLVMVDAGACSTATAPTARAPSRRAAPDELARCVRRLPRRAARRRSTASAPGSTGVEADAARARRDRRRRLRRALRPRARPRRRPRGPRGAAALDRSRATRSRRATSSRSSRGSTSRAVGGVRIEDLVVVTRGRLGAPDALPQGARHASAEARYTRRRMAETVNTNQFRNGMHIELDGERWRIVEFQHVKPGKGGAFVRTKLKSLDSGAVVDTHLPRRREVHAHPHRGEEGAVPLRRGRRRRLHGRRRPTSSSTSRASRSPT